MEDMINAIGMPLIAVLVPIAVAGFRKLMPRIPPMWLPVMAAAIGPIADQVIFWLSGIDVAEGWAVVLLGLAGVGLREVADQIRKAIGRA